MNTNLVDVHLHGTLIEGVGREHWRLAVTSVAEAVRAIDMLSKRSLTKHLLRHHKGDANEVQYKILVNEQPFLTEEQPCVERPETILNSELCMTHANGSLKRIDIVPVLEGAGKMGFMLVIFGVLMILTAGMAAAGTSLFATVGTGLGATVTALGGVSAGTLLMGGFSLLVGGIAMLSMNPPEYDDHTEIDISKGAGGARSYLFNGPQNSGREGGPVPIGYGRLMVGSTVIQATQSIRDVAANKSTAIAHNTTVTTDYSDGTPTLVYGDITPRAIF
jgi:predicted phage tail protein